MEVIDRTDRRATLVPAVPEADPAAAIGLVIHHERELAVSVAHEVIQWAADRGHRVVVVEADAARLAEASVDSAAAPAPDVVEGFAGLGLVVVVGVGGDGTMLRAAELAAAEATPILGVHAGQIGYFTAVEAADSLESLDAFLR